MVGPKREDATQARQSSRQTSTKARLTQHHIPATTSNTMADLRPRVTKRERKLHLR